MTPVELRALAELRRRGQAPELAVVVTDEWRTAPALADVGMLGIRVNPANDCNSDWSPLSGLWVIVAQWRTPLSRDSRLVSAILGSNPQLLETFERKAFPSSIVWDSVGEWSGRGLDRIRRDYLLLKHMIWATQQ